LNLRSPETTLPLWLRFSNYPGSNWHIAGIYWGVKSSADIILKELQRPDY